MSTIVNPGAVVISLASNSANAVTFQNATALKATKSVDGTVRKLANGRYRAVVRDGSRRTYELALQLCDRNQIDWLEDHVGAVVLVRDDRGRKVYATYFEVPVQELTFRTDYGDVTLTITEITHKEDV